MNRLTEWRNGHGAVVDNRENYIDNLATYEDMEESGLLVKIPCKVGDMVFYRKGEFVYGDTVKRIVFDGLDNQIVLDCNHCFLFSDIGRKAFLKREEAYKEEE